MCATVTVTCFCDVKLLKSVKDSHFFRLEPIPAIYGQEAHPGQMAMTYSQQCLHTVLLLHAEIRSAILRYTTR